MPETAKMTPDPRKTAPLPDMRGQVGDNGPDRDEYLFLVGRMRDAQEKLDEAKTLRKKVRQAAKLRGLDLEIVDLVEKVAGEEDETHLERLKKFQRYTQFQGLPIGFQMQLFDAPQNGGAPGNSEEALLTKAYTSGYERGIQGLNPDEDAYPPALPEGQEHMRGWHDGQKVLQDKFVRFNEEMAAAEAAKAAKKGKKNSNAEDEGATEH